MQIIARDTHPDMAAMLEAYDCPAILVSGTYEILASNQRYQDSFGEIENAKPAYCYKVSHGYQVPCDQAGEDCPLSAAKRSGQKERVLHIHQTPRGKEHVDVEMLPINDAQGNLKFFVELLKPVEIASVEIDRNEMVGSSPAFNRMLANITRVGPTEASVLLLGESGSGKELAAMAIHNASKRKAKPMVSLECAGLTESLFESELFGHTKGAFTGANYHKKGLVESAAGGTLFLDEIADVPLDLQVKLLRLIESGTYRPVGSHETRRSDFRLICATHRNLHEMVEQGAFRQDLYYRINVFPLHLPSLNERNSDIPLLAKAMLNKLDKRGKFILTDSAMTTLKKHHYVGNIRELRNILARSMVLANTHLIDGKVVNACLAIDDFAASKTDPRQAGKQTGEMPNLKNNEANYLQDLLKSCEGDKEKAAKIAGISLRSLYRKLS